ncbi:MAG: WD40 repeat domain-containing protein, partial [Planctomycetota bacterium]
MSLLRPLLAICLLLTAVAVAGEAPADLRVGEEVEVAADAAAVKVRDRVVAALKRGDRVTVERLWADRLWTTVEAGGKEVSGWVPIDQVRRVAAPALPPLELGDEVVVAAETAEVLAEGETVATLERRYMFIVEAVREGAVATTVDVAGRAVRGWVERARVRRLRPGQDLPVGKGDQVVVTADAAPVVRGDQTLTTLERRYVFTVEAVRDGKLATTVDLEGQPARGWVDAGLVRRATPRDLPQRIRLWAITERPLCTIALASVVRESLAVAPEALRVAYVERAEDGQRVVVDGRPGPVYAAIGPGMPRFGPGGEHVAYTALEEGRWRVVVDNFAGQPFDRVNALTFSPDGRRVAHAALQARKWRIVLDGQAGPAFDDVGRKALAFSADGEHLAYAAKEYDRWAVVLDGERGMAFDEVKALRFSPHGARLLYLGREGSRWHVVVDGEKGPPFATIEERTWSPNGRRYAYVGRREGRFQVVVDGRVGPPCDGVLEGTPVFSPDGRRVAYGVVRGETAQAIVDGKAGPEYDGIAGLAFSPDSRRVAYAAQKGVVWHVVVDGEEGLP